MYRQAKIEAIWRDTPSDQLSTIFVDSCRAMIANKDIGRNALEDAVIAADLEHNSAKAQSTPFISTSLPSASLLSIAVNPFLLSVFVVVNQNLAKVMIDLSDNVDMTQVLGTRMRQWEQWPDCALIPRFCARYEHERGSYHHFIVSMDSYRQYEADCVRMNFQHLVRFFERRLALGRLIARNRFSVCPIWLILKSLSGLLHTGVRFIQVGVLRCRGRGVKHQPQTGSERQPCMPKLSMKPCVSEMVLLPGSVYRLCSA